MYPANLSYLVLLQRDEKEGGFGEDTIIIYNRVPKTGSTSLAGVTYDLCTINKYHVIHLNTSRNQRTLSLADQVRLC